MGAPHLPKPRQCRGKDGPFERSCGVASKGTGSQRTYFGTRSSRDFTGRLFFSGGGGERATFFKTFFVCDMILAVNIMRCNNKLSWFQNYAKLYARVSVAYHLFAPTFWTLTSEKKKKTNMRHISKVNTSHFIDVFVDLSSILLERSPVPHPPLHCNTNVLP